jgi:hypothetical protein
LETLLFLIIAGILSSIFGKGRGRKTSRRGGFEEIRTLIDKQLGIEKQSAPQKAPPVDVSPSVEAKSRQVKQVRENIEVPVIPVPVPAKETVEIRMQDVKEEDSKIEELNPQTVLNGLIWAEVLGEPRARNPYFPRKG